VSLDSLELQLASAVQRYNTLQRRAEASREPAQVLSRALAELSTALEEVRVAQEQLVENRLRMEQLQMELQRQLRKYLQLFDEMPQAYVVTTPDTTITEVNKAAAELFNVSQRFLVGKPLSVFVCEDRTGLLTASRRITQDTAPTSLTLKLRPRERAPLTVDARVSGDESGLRWILKPADSPRTTE